MCLSVGRIDIRMYIPTSIVLVYDNNDVSCPFSLICSLLLKDLSFNFYLLLLQLVLCRVAALKSLPVHHP